MIVTKKIIWIRDPTWRFTLNREKTNPLKKLEKHMERQISIKIKNK